MTTVTVGRSDTGATLFGASRTPDVHAATGVTSVRVTSGTTSQPSAQVILKIREAAA